MQITIDPSKLSGLNAIVSRLNAVEGAEQTTAEAYLTERIHEILDSYSASELERIKSENAEFYNIAASLPLSKQEQIKALVQQLASE